MACHRCGKDLVVGAYRETNGICTCENCCAELRHDELAAERAAGFAEAYKNAQDLIMAETQVMPTGKLRAQIEKVRDELKSKMTGSYASAQDRMTAAACNALRMLEAILEGKEP